MSNQEPVFVTREYLSRRITMPLEHALFGLATYVKLRASVSIDDSIENITEVDGYVVISEVDYKQSIEFKNTEVLQIAKPPILKKVLLTKYSGAPELNGQVVNVLDHHSVYEELMNPIYCLEEVLQHCKINRIPYHKPANTVKVKLNSPELNNHCCETTYPVQLQLAIDAYHFWHHKKEDATPDVQIRKWLNTTSIELGIGYSGDSDLVTGISKKTEDTIIKIIKPD